MTLLHFCPLLFGIYSPGCGCVTYHYVAHYRMSNALVRRTACYLGFTAARLLVRSGGKRHTSTLLPAYATGHSPRDDIMFKPLTFLAYYTHGAR